VVGRRLRPHKRFVIVLAVESGHGQYSKTPSLRSPEFENEDENEASALQLEKIGALTGRICPQCVY